MRQRQSGKYLNDDDDDDSDGGDQVGKLVYIFTEMHISRHWGYSVCLGWY